MIYKELKRNLFEMNKEYHLAHCIASDLKMTAGIAVQFQKKFNVRGKILKTKEQLSHPTCILTGRVFNLITKKKSGGKPTLQSLKKSIQKMRDIATEKKIKKIAMPKIGCGLDKLNWIEVRSILKETFTNTNIELVVCYL